MTMHEETHDMYRATYGDRAVHSDIATLLKNVALVYEKKRWLERAADMYKERNEMERIIHGADSMHPDIANSSRYLNAIERV